jgi:hypothetical protein
MMLHGIIEIVAIWTQLIKLPPATLIRAFGVNEREKTALRPIGMRIDPLVWQTDSVNIATCKTHHFSSSC